MWDDFKIGTGEHGNVASNTPNIRGVTASISHNWTSFWLSDCLCGAGGRIMKDTTTGKKLELLLADEIPSAAKINKLVDGVVMKHLSATALRKFVHSALENAHTKGYEAAQHDIRKAIGVRS